MSSEALTALATAACTVNVAAGLLFLSAGARKLMHWQEFRGVVAAYRVLPESSTTGVAAAVVALELLLGAAAILDRGMPLTGIGIAVMLAVFAVAMAINLRRGRTAIDCGCFQTALRQQLEWRLVARNIVCSLIVLLASMAPGLPDSTHWLLALPAGAALFSLYLALNGVWALDASRRAAFGRS
jgi:uncharacterized membrane protein YphA (DoxX/SURF4 family)